MTATQYDPRTAQEAREGDCLVFFVCLVTAALAMTGLTLFTGLEAVPRLLLAGAVTLLVGVVTSAVAS